MPSTRAAIISIDKSELTLIQCIDSPRIDHIHDAILIDCDALHKLQCRTVANFVHLPRWERFDLRIGASIIVRCNNPSKCGRYTWQHARYRQIQTIRERLDIRYQIISRNIMVQIDGIGPFNLAAISESNGWPFVDDAKLSFFRWHLGQWIRTTLCGNECRCRQCRHDARPNHNSIHICCRSDDECCLLLVICAKDNFTCKWVVDGNRQMFQTLMNWRGSTHLVCVCVRMGKWHKGDLRVIQMTQVYETFNEWKNAKQWLGPVEWRSTRENNHHYVWYEVRTANTFRIHRKRFYAWHARRFLVWTEHRPSPTDDGTHSRI